MDTATISIIIAIISCILGVASFLSNRDKKSSSDSEWKGTVNAKLDIIISLQTDVTNIKTAIQNHETRICILEKENEKRS